jgi:hypothetical protein
MVVVPEEEPVEEMPAEPEPPKEEVVVQEPPDFMEVFLAADTALTDVNFRGGQIFDDFEEAFRYPNKKWRNKFPLLVIEDDDRRRNHFFNALANRLKENLNEPVSLLSIKKLVDALALKSSFDWNGLLNRLARSHVVLIDDCASVAGLPQTALSYLSMIVAEIVKRDTLLMIGMSKRYQKDAVFGGVHKKASRKKL